jgi:hypothetical protein
MSAIPMIMIIFNPAFELISAFISRTSGTYYLRTNAESPFALGDEVFGWKKEEKRT